MVYISSLLDETKQVSEIFLNYSVAPALPEFEVNWRYGLTPHPHQLTICAATLRPLTHSEGRTWLEQAQEAFGFSEDKELFKGCKYIGEYILKYKRQPVREELAVFYFNRYVVAGKKSTLPFLASEWIDDLLAAYEPVFKEGYSIAQIVATLKESTSIEKRVALEAV